MSSSYPSPLEKQWQEIIEEMSDNKGRRVAGWTHQETYLLAGMLEYHYQDGVTDAEELKKVVMAAYQKDKELEKDRQMRKDVKEIREAGAKRIRKYRQEALDQQRVRNVADKTSDVMDRYLGKQEPAKPVNASFTKKIMIGLASAATFLALTQLMISYFQ